MSLQGIVKRMIKRQCRLMTSELNACQKFAIWRRNHIMTKSKSVDKEGYRKYKEYYKHFGLPAPKSEYRIFSPSLPKDIMVTPEIVIQNLLMPIMNPLEYRGYYVDKNNFERILDPKWLPQAVIRRIDGFFYDRNYQTLNSPNDKCLNDLLELSGFNKFILKPSVDSSSGAGIKMIERKSEGIFMLDKYRLTVDILREYGRNFIIQEALSQSDYMAQFNLTSVNTLRITTYRSVVDNKVKILWHILRIGAKGAIVDNAHAGGAFIGIDSNGRIGKYLKDQYNNAYTKHNGIDFSKSDFQIPDWEKVLDFARQVSNKIQHHRYVQLDVMIDSNGNPRLIEYNLGAASVWLGMMTGQAAFGNYSDEILNYCCSHKNKAIKVISSIS